MTTLDTEAKCESSVAMRSGVDMLGQTRSVHLPSVGAVRLATIPRVLIYSCSGRPRRRFCLID